ncbi:hypothetical protein [Geobacillus sp. JS12]|nr:hypothetical protein [Geobacillus sp. JS12]
MFGILASPKTVHVLLRKVMALVGVLVLSIVAFGLANPNQAGA